MEGSEYSETKKAISAIETIKLQTYKPTDPSLYVREVLYLEL